MACVFGLFLILGCSQNDKIIVEIVHNQAQITSNNQDFVVTNATHILFSIYDGSVADAPARFVYTRDIKEITQLPFTFEIDRELIDQDMYSAQATVFQNEGNLTTMGDLMSEYIIPIKRNAKKVIVEVTGLEDCKAPNAGGYCASD